MIVPLAQSVIEVGGDTLARHRNHLHQHGDARRRSYLTVQESVKPKAPGHDTQTGLLSAFPMRSLLGRILSPPILDELPEQFGTPRFPCTPIGPYERVNKAKAAGFPDNFYVAVAKITDLTP